MQVVSVPTPAVQRRVRSPTCKLQTWPYVDRSCAQTGGEQCLRAARGPCDLNRPRRACDAERRRRSFWLARPRADRTRTESWVRAAAGPAETVASVEPDEAVPMPKPRPLQTAAATRRDIPDNVRRALTPPIRAEDDDGVQVRAYALPDGRRVTVYRYENPAERAVISRNDLYERRQVRLPFLSLFD